MPTLLTVQRRKAVLFLTLYVIIIDMKHFQTVCIVEARHATVKLLSLIYGRLDERALRVGKPISSSARSQAFYSSIVCTSTL